MSSADPIRRRQSRLTPAFALTALALSQGAVASQPATGTSLPQPRAPFDGAIGESVRTSVPGTPHEIRTPRNAPNVLLVLTDDVGFGAASTFGGPVPTPNLDALARRGLRYNRFHVTAMCSPTRAALLTGRNHHAIGQGIVPELRAEYPGYDIRMPASAATVGRILHDNGYDTAFIGKHHNIDVSRLSLTGPFDTWPTHLGFDYFYGFILGETDQFAPTLYQGTSPVDLSQRPADYILDADLADKAIGWVRQQQATGDSRPFFMYYATGSTHAPHQAPREWIDRFRGRFDEGWDRVRRRTFADQKRQGVIPANADIAPRPEEIPAWDSLSPQQKRVYARYMEVYAAQLSFQDAQFGRIVDELKRIGQYDNTLIIFIEGDNGASWEGGPLGKVIDYGQALNGLTDSDEWSEEMLDLLGGPQTAPLYPAGWAWAMNSPFPWAKRTASHLGGTRNGMVLSWPDKITDPGNRSQYTHVVDVLPTILEATGIAAPDVVDGVPQQRIDGISFAYSFNAAQAPSQRTTQYYELLGNRAIYHDGWLASTTPPAPPWQTDRQPGDVLDYDWELYDLERDFSQTRNLAARYPERLASLRTQWLDEAKRNDVLPLDNRFFRNKPPRPRSEYVYWGPVSVPRSGWPAIFGRSFALTADIEIESTQASGIVAAAGSHLGGWSFYLSDGRPAVAQAVSSRPGDQYRVVSTQPVEAGMNRITWRFEADAPGLFKGGTMSILIGDRQVASGRIERTIGMPLPDGETFDIGRDGGAQVILDDPAIGQLAGRIDKVVVKVEP